jgi:hypothetical protein
MPLSTTTSIPPASNSPETRVERIELGSPGSYLRQIPPDWRSSSSYSSLSVQGSTSLEDATDGADRGWSFQRAIEQGGADRFGSMLAEVACLRELLAKRQNERFDAGRGAVAWACRGCRFAAPVDAIESLSVRTPHPSLYNRQAYAKRACHLAHPDTGTHLRDHTSAALLDSSS